MSTTIYPIRRAIERAVATPGARPVRCFAVLLPVWRVEIRTTIRDSEPYEVFDRFLTRGIAEAGLTTVPELAGFFGVEESLVIRALGFLESLGHIRSDGTRSQLTELGSQSVRDGARYRIKEDRRYLYFDGYGCAPFPRTHYASGLFSDDDAFEGTDRTRFTRLGSIAGFDHAQIRAVLTRPDHRDYNVPDGLSAPEPLTTTPAWLPAYLVLDAGPLGLQAFTRAVEGRDTHVERFCAEVTDALRAEDDRKNPLADWQDWLKARGYSGVRPRRLSNGVLRATLPEREFGPEGLFSLHQLGSFEVRDSSFLQLWCDDAGLRHRAVLERAGNIARSRSAGATEADIQRLAELLEVAPPSVDAVRS